MNKLKYCNIAYVCAVCMHVCMYVYCNEWGAIRVRLELDSLINCPHLDFVFKYYKHLLKSKSNSFLYITKFLFFVNKQEKTIHKITIKSNN